MIDFMLPKYLVMVAYVADNCWTTETKAEVTLLGNNSAFGEVEKIILTKAKEAPSE